MTTKSKSARNPVDVPADRPRWQTEEFLPDLSTIRWERLDEARGRHVSLVADLRAAVIDGDQAAEDSALTALGDFVVEVCRELWLEFPEGEEAFRTAAAAVTPKSAVPDGSMPIAPVPATSEEERTSVLDAANAQAEKFDQAYRGEVERLRPARAVFDAEAEEWRALYRRLEPVFLAREGAVSVDVREVERHRGLTTEEAS